MRVREAARDGGSLGSSLVGAEVRLDPAMSPGTIRLMIRGVLQSFLLSGVGLLSACSTLGGYPSEWHSTSNVIHAYVSDSGRAVEIPVTEGITLIDVVLQVAKNDEGDLTRVVVYRRAGSEVLRFDVDVRDMLLTGRTVNNLQLRAGDVVGIAG